MEFAQSAPMALQRITHAGDASLILILSDINMPGMSGLELLPKAKAIRPDVPIIIITTYGDAETKRRALEDGAETLLTKPIDFGTRRNEAEFPSPAFQRIGAISARSRRPDCKRSAPERLADELRETASNSDTLSIHPTFGRRFPRSGTRLQKRAVLLARGDRGGGLPDHAHRRHHGPRP
jgi:CheY-like chemotaxis protein